MRSGDMKPGNVTRQPVEAAESFDGWEQSCAS